MKHRDADQEDVEYVVAHLRACDVEEQFARRWDDDRDKLAATLVGLCANRRIRSFAFPDRAGRPACVLSAFQLSPGAALLHAISTDAWPDVARAVFLCGTRVLMPTLQAGGLRRAQCDTLASNVRWRNMLARMGFVEEGIERAGGKAGQDFVRAAWLNPTIDAVRRPVVSGPMAPGPGDD